MDPVCIERMMFTNEGRSFMVSGMMIRPSLGESGGWTRGLLSLTVAALLFGASACGDGGGGSGDGASIENVPREGWTCGTNGMTCTCGALETDTGYCPDWNETWCCILSAASVGAPKTACDCTSPDLLGQIGMTCEAFAARSNAPEWEIVPICPPAPVAP